MIYINIKNRGEYIFSSSTNRLNPISYASVNKSYKISLGRIGITERIRKERGLSFHSYRHYYNSLLIESGVSDAVIRRIIGHKSIGMTENYTHIDTKSITYSSLSILRPEEL